MADIDLIVTTRLEFLTHVRAAQYVAPAGFEDATRAFVEAEMRAGRHHTWIAEGESEAVAGVVSMLLWPRPPQPEDMRTVEGYIINMFVLPDSQRRGVGDQLLTACLASADEFGIRKFVLHSTDAGRALYRASGFEQKDNWMELPVDPA